MDYKITANCLSYEIGVHGVKKSMGIAYFTLVNLDILKI